MEALISRNRGLEKNSGYERESEMIFKFTLSLKRKERGGEKYSAAKQSFGNNFSIIQQYNNLYRIS